MDRTQKEQQITELREKLTKSVAILLAEYRGLTVPAVTTLREDFRKQQCEYKVYKNTLIKRAIVGTPMEKMGKYLEGPTVVVFAWESPSAPAKVARVFAKGNDKFKVKGGYLDGNVLDDKSMIGTADLPGKDEIRAALLATLNAPATNLVRTLNAAAQNFVYLLDAQRRGLEGQG